MSTSGPWSTPHTPPPWISHDTEDGEWVVDLPETSSASVTRLFFGDMETNTGTDIANANLAAAAPDLHEAASYFLNSHREASGRSCLCVFCQRFRAAVAKALGEPS